MIGGQASSGAPLLDELRRRHGLDLVSVRAGEHGGSRVVAHVRDPDGRDLLLKHTIPNRGAGELAALRAWSETGRAAHFYAELAPDVYLAEWLLGPSLAEIPRHQTVDDAAIGGMLRELHLVGLPPGLRPVRDRFAPGIVETWPQLPPPMVALGERLAGGLYAYDPQHDVLLHGDLVPSHVILTVNGPKVIDPYGDRGLPGWDLAQLAVSAAGRGRRRMITGLVSGYGSQPPLLAELAAWLTLLYFHKNLLARSELLDNLRPMAETLVALGDADRYLAWLSAAA